MIRKHKKILARIIVSATVLAILCIIRALAPNGIPLAVAIPLFFIPYIICAYDVLFTAFRNLFSGQIFDENLLMSIATVGAFIIGEYPEAVFVMLFYQAGELFQSIAVGKSRNSIASLMDICPETANVIRDGEILSVFPDEVEIGETVIVYPGERIPIDGTLIDGTSELNTMALTGESLPLSVSPGKRVASGCINLNSPLKIKTETDYQSSTVAKILELVEDAASRKAKPEKFISRFARYYTPCVVFGALLLAVIPGFITGNFAEWIHRALIFLVISCPCALVISVPLSYFGGIGAASKKGILVKGANFLEALAKADTVAFDKTGTLTKGQFSVTNFSIYETNEINDLQALLGIPKAGANASEKALFTLAAAIEKESTHPIARSIVTAYEARYEKTPLPQLKNVIEHSGMGITAELHSVRVAAGNARLMKSLLLLPTENTVTGSSVLFIAFGNKVIGHFLISDTLKTDSADAIKALYGHGINRTAMLTGDHPDVAVPLSEKLGINICRASLLPADKISAIEELSTQLPKGKKLVFVGDGINDAPVLSRADIGIAMGALGSDAAIEAADIVLMDDKLSALPTAIRISKRTNAIVIQNIVFALTVKLAFLALGALGFSNLWLAVFADVGVSVLAILNAMRTLKLK